MMRMYTKDTLNELDEDVKDCLDKAQNLDKIRWNKDYHNNLYERQAKRLLKLRKLLERDLTVEFFGQKNFGLVLVNNKFVVCLLNNEWRTVRKNKQSNYESDKIKESALACSDSIRVSNSSIFESISTVFDFA